MNRLLFMLSLLAISNGILAQSFELLYGQYFQKPEIETVHPEYVRTAWTNFGIVKVRALFSPLDKNQHVFAISFTSYHFGTDIELGTLEDVSQNLHAGQGVGKTRSYDISA